MDRQIYSAKRKENETIFRELVLNSKDFRENLEIEVVLYSIKRPSEKWSSVGTYDILHSNRFGVSIKYCFLEVPMKSDNFEKEVRVKEYYESLCLIGKENNIDDARKAIIEETKKLGLDKSLLGCFE